MILPLCGLALLPAVLFAQAVPLTQDNGNGTDSTYWGGAANKGIIAGAILVTGTLGNLAFPFALQNPPLCTASAQNPFTYQTLLTNYKLCK